MPRSNQRCVYHVYAKRFKVPGSKATPIKTTVSAVYAKNVAKQATRGETPYVYADVHKVCTTKLTRCQHRRGETNCRNLAKKYKPRHML